MKGTVLGFDGTTGAILSADEKRYAFDVADWKGERPPQARDEVDFVANGEIAEQIYVTRNASLFSGGNVDFAGSLSKSAKAVQDGLSQASADGSFENAKIWAKTNPHAINAAIVILASFILTYVSFVGLHESGSISHSSLVGMPGDVADLKSQIMVLKSNLNQVGSIFGGASVGQGGLQEAAETASWIFSLAYFLYLIPLFAAAIIYLAVKARRNRLLELGLGGLTLCGLGYYLLVREAVANLADNIAFGNPEAVRQAFSFGFGGWIISACGIASILIALGLIKATSLNAMSPAS